MNKIAELLTKIDLNSLITIFDIQIALAIIIISFLFKSVISKFIIKIVYIFSKHEKTNVKNSKMYAPLKRMVLYVGIYIALRIIPTSKQIAYYINEIFKVITIIFITKGITSIMTKDSKLFKRILNISEDDTVNDFFCKLFRLLTWIVSIFIIMTELGFNLTGLATGLGIVSAVIALAAQELVKNLLSGFSILTDKPFVLGDWIEVGEYAGSVIDISFRSTRIKTTNNSIITIPNSIIASEYVINWNRLKSRRLDLILSLNLNTPTEKIKKTIKEIKLVLKNNPKVIEDTVQVHFDQIDNSSNKIKIFLYINETEYLKFLNAKQEVLCSLLTLIEKENIELAYPTQTIYVKNTGGED
ncbi:MAG: mechanosensitive ion channel family protein [Clostridia bacterium]|nr:mechanosensitive ion channel family protein [Clostridia bacterium]